jgi:hypothetical protein
MAPAFAMVWGGLISTIGKDIVLKVVPVAGQAVEVIKVYDPTDTAVIDQTNYSATLTIPNIFADETKNVLFDINVKPVATDSSTAETVLQLVASYRAAPDFNRDVQVSISVPVQLSRPFKVIDDKPDVLVDINVHRMAAVEAMQTAIALNQQGKIKEAQKCLLDATTAILASPHIQVGVHSAVLKALVSDLKMCFERLSTNQTSSERIATLTCCRQQMFTERTSISSSAGGMHYSTPTQNLTQGQFTSQ